MCHNWNQKLPAHITLSVRVQVIDSRYGLVDASGLVDPRRASAQEVAGSAENLPHGAHG